MGRKTRNQGQPDRRALEEKTATKNHMTVDSETDGEAELAKPGRLIHIGKWQFRLPQSRFLRLLIGIGFIVGGILGFLPILGFWMIPLGVADSLQRRSNDPTLASAACRLVRQKPTKQKPPREWGGLIRFGDRDRFRRFAGEVTVKRHLIGGLEMAGEVFRRKQWRRQPVDFQLSRYRFEFCGVCCQLQRKRFVVRLRDGRQFLQTDSVKKTSGNPGGKSGPQFR